MFANFWPCPRLKPLSACPESDPCFRCFGVIFQKQVADGWVSDFPPVPTLAGWGLLTLFFWPPKGWYMME